jgi:hypothetical protein
LLFAFHCIILAAACFLPEKSTKADVSISDSEKIPGVGINFIGGQDLLDKRVEYSKNIKGRIKMIVYSPSGEISFLVLADDGRIYHYPAYNWKVQQ